MYYRLVQIYPYHHHFSVALLYVRKLLVVIHQVYLIVSSLSSYMESYDEHHVSYDSLPYGLLVAVVTKKPAHVTNPRYPALCTHRLLRSPVQVYSLRDPQAFHCHSSLASAYDAYYQRLIAVDSQLSLC
jgi:hypothetical protein